MSLKNILCVAAMAALTASPALAVPIINLDDTGTGVATLQIILDAEGSIAPELAVELGAGLTLTGASIADATTFNTANPGDSPWINGLDAPEGGDADGLVTDLGAGQIFAAYGSNAILSAGTYDFLTINYTGSGDITATGLVAQLSALNAGLSDTLTIGTPQRIGDTDGDGDIDATDLATLSQNWDPFGSTGTFATGDFDGDGDIDATDLAGLSQNWDPFGTGGGPSASGAAAPEPTTLALLSLLGGIGSTFVRRRK